MNLVQGLASVYVLVLLVFTLGFLINWYRNRATMRAYKRIGFWAGIIYVIFELLTLALTGGMFLSPHRRADHCGCAGLGHSADVGLC